MKYEYDVVRIDASDTVTMRQGHKGEKEYLNKRDSEGWHLVTVTASSMNWVTYYYFKKELL